MRFLGVFILKPTEIAKVLLKNSTRDFQNSPPFERSAYFYVIISESFKRFQYFNFETNFLKNENFFQKTGVLFLVEITKIESTSFSLITGLSGTNVKTNRMTTAKWAKEITKSGVLPVTTFFFFGNFFQF